MSRFFVTVYARSADELRGLQAQGLDLFAQTAKKAKARSSHPFTIDGLITLAEAGSLVQAGCRVLIEDTLEARSNKSGEALEFTEWLQGQQPALAADRGVD